jgi:hypothetical protein
MSTKKARINSIIFILALTFIVAALFFLFAYIQKLSKAEQATEQEVKRVEMQCHEAEQHILQQDSMIQVLRNELKLLQEHK